MNSEEDKKGKSLWTSFTDTAVTYLLLRLKMCTDL